jgi:hypothetical protein
MDPLKQIKTLEEQVAKLEDLSASDQARVKALEKQIMVILSRITELEKKLCIPTPPILPPWQQLIMDLNSLPNNQTTAATTAPTTVATTSPQKSSSASSSQTTTTTQEKSQPVIPFPLTTIKTPTQKIDDDGEHDYDRNGEWEKGKWKPHHQKTEQHIEQHILSVLQTCYPQGISAKDIAAKMGFTGRSSVNPMLYGMSERGQLIKTKTVPPLWQLAKKESETPQQLAVTLDKSTFNFYIKTLENELEKIKQGLRAQPPTGFSLEGKQMVQSWIDNFIPMAKNRLNESKQHEEDYDVLQSYLKAIKHMSKNAVGWPTWSQDSKVTQYLKSTVQWTVPASEIRKVIAFFFV